MFNPTDIKKDFPIFRNFPDLVFVDNASTTQKPEMVIQKMRETYEYANANIHRAVYDLGISADKMYNNTKKQIVDFFQVSNDDYGVVFTAGTTDGINKLAGSIEKSLKAGENIVVSEMEHHSNFVPWLEVCKRNGLELRVANIQSNGDIDLEHLEQLIDKKTKVVSIVHISNTLGTINDLSHVAQIAKKQESYFIVDAAQSCALFSSSLSDLGADAIVFSGHKMFGPTGIGVILGKKEFLLKLPPMVYGGGMVHEVSKAYATYKDNIGKHEAGTPPIVQIAGLNSATEYLNNLDIEKCRGHLRMLATKMREGLQGKAIIQGSPNHYTGIISCNFKEIHPHDAASFMNSKNIAVRAGHHCTQLIMKKYNIQSSVRFSFSIYNTIEDVENILTSIEEMKAYFV